MERVVIPTPRPGLMLLQLIPTDAEAYFALLDEDRAHLSQYGDNTAAKYPTVDAVRESIVHPQNPEKLRFGIWDGGTFVGMVGLTPLGHGVCETGGWTGKRFIRRGYGTVTRLALARYALDTLGYRHVLAKTHPDNLASQGMLERAGFRLARRHRTSYHYFFVP